jgi:uncharacterized protein HemX
VESSTTPTPSGPGPATDPQARIDGLRAWLAQLDRKLGVRTYIVAAVLVLALAAAGVALFLALQQKQDGATEDDLNAVRAQLATVQQQATTAAQKPVQSLTQRLGDLENEISTLQSHQRTSDRELQVVQDDIRELRDQVARSGSSGNNVP